MDTLDLNHSAPWPRDQPCCRASPLQMPVETMISTDDIATSLMGTDKLSGRTIGPATAKAEERTGSVRTGSWEVALGRSMRAWMERMGLSVGGSRTSDLG
jgi:hypothetical protein